MNSDKLTAKQVKACLDDFHGKPKKEISEKMLSALWEASGKIAYTAIRTLYTKECTPYFLKLLYQALYSFEKAKNAEYKRDLEKENFMHDDLKTQKKKLVYFVDKAESNDLFTTENEFSAYEISLLSLNYEKVYQDTLELIGENDEKSEIAGNNFLRISNDLPELSEKIEKENKRNLKHENIKKTFVPIKPKTNRKTSEKGKLYDLETANYKSFTNDDFQDVAQEAFTALWECYRARMIKKQDDIWTISRYAYSKVRKYITSNRKVYNQVNTYVAFTSGSDKDGTYYEKHLTDKRAQSEFNKIDNREVLEAIKQYLLENLDKRSNKQNIVSAFILNYYGYTFDKIGEKLGVSKMMISKYISYAKDCLSTENGYQLLRDLIENR